MGSNTEVLQNNDQLITTQLYIVNDLFKLFLFLGPQTALKTALLQQMEQHFSGYESNYHLAVCTLLDPRFKRHAFTNAAALEAASQRLLAEITEIVDSSDTLTTTPSNKVENDADDSSFWNMFDRKVSEAGAIKNTAASEAENERRRYYQEANLPRTADPLQWWKLNEIQFPHMKALAHKYLCIPAISVSSDRLFSKLGQRVDAGRDAIKPHSINTILFLNKNMT